MDLINTFVSEIWPKIPDVIGGLAIVCMAAYFVWSTFFKKEKQPRSIPEPDDESTLDIQDLSETIADAINEANNNDSSN